MKRVDVLVIGAGPAAYGALVGLAHSMSATVLQLTGADLQAFGPGAWLNGGLARTPVAAELGLPAVRAFGAGGTTRLWHGGLFVPDADDEMVSEGDGIGRASDLLPHLQGVLAQSHGQPPGAFHALGMVVQRALECASGGGPIRQVFIPRARRELSADCFRQAGAAFAAYDMASAAVVDMAMANGRVEVLCAGRDGYFTLAAERIVLAAGVLGSGLLMRRLLRLPQLAFSDHYHVFAGVIASKHVAALARNEAALAGGQFHNSLKFTVALGEGARADVLFSFRKVSNPDFPRAGRRFGKFVGINALSRRDKLELLLKNPMTGIEMLAYVWGVELPLQHSLVHATVSMRSMSGRITEAGVQPNVPQAAITAAVRQAWARMCDALGIAAGAVPPFSADQIHDSVISGAQFVGSLSDDALSAAHPLLAQLVIADCSRFKFTSVYNQGLVSLAAGYASVTRQK